MWSKKWEENGEEVPCKPTGGEGEVGGRKETDKCPLVLKGKRIANECVS